MTRKLPREVIPADAFALLVRERNAVESNHGRRFFGDAYDPLRSSLLLEGCADFVALGPDADALFTVQEEFVAHMAAGERRAPRLSRPPTLEEFEGSDTTTQEDVDEAERELEEAESEYRSRFPTDGPAQLAMLSNAYAEGFQVFRQRPWIDVGNTTFFLFIQDRRLIAISNDNLMEHAISPAGMTLDGLILTRLGDSRAVVWAAWDDVPHVLELAGVVPGVLRQRAPRGLPALAPEDANFSDTHSGSEWGNRCFAHIRAHRWGAAEAACWRGLSMVRQPRTASALLFNLALIDEQRSNFNDALAWLALARRFRGSSAIDMTVERIERARAASR